MPAHAHQDRPGHTELGRVLMSGGALPSDWAPSFAAVPRSAFLPELMWPFDIETGTSVPVSRSDDPATWYEYADADVPVVTQWDDGQHTGTEPGQVPTSSASMPSVVFRMLRDLDAHPGDRVLEVGTGTGWNAALLAHRTGAQNVVTIEVDRTVAERARTTLERFGTAVRVIHGDGYAGHPEDAPYDRIIATAGVRHIPFTWVAQTRPGGLIVVPWGTHYGNGDCVARLAVAPDGQSASGAFTGPVEFMKLRAQRLSPVVHGDHVTGGHRDVSATDLTEDAFLGERFSPQRFAVGLRVPHCHHVIAEKRDGARPVWFYGLTDRSWACVLFRDGDTARVWQSGPRRIWDEAEAAYRWWENERKPEYGRFGLTVTGAGQTAWLDTPDRSWPV
ncbi:methyltransferase domain-containing protein [Streptomyces clavuligerus]|uniref:Protein-L-isoaspartate O-methyltransferase n=1 Tax=Streptomyces clavuligerus TaxID=1901 RepID=E2Q5L8_STRCL|nr:methyltransferase domain-containing protein [Streptomyces clavuligerus]ANW18169.1 protein-L-isoaspartate(D-aspartate) O-methyltransferase [Streptomyces clavuligerus]AXU12729.1 methyltransferase domain-containing protein [Streptomyces clavuligerus]EFG09232.1 protein-L-isoaspartate D-aspartate O-methyltransferase [Streptomyces clavuligerus]MBY6302635.1 methyltransferase domain-containing protein [Streptomyces clavuligerus]QCS05513.1 methyltransferase domain-containing protein [Streptomyces cl